MDNIMQKQYKALTFNNLCSLLSENKKTLIICHAHPDGDAIGSAFALKGIFTKLGIESYCICEDEVPKRMKFLTVSIQSSSLPSAIPEGFIPERIITVDTASLLQMGKLQNFFKDRIDIMIDHHKSNEPYADNFIDPCASATGEIIYKVANALLSEKGILIPLDICRCLYAAISSDTGCFKYSNVTPTTHIIAANLVKSGIDGAEINRLLFDSKSKERLEAEKIALSNLKSFMNGKVCVVPIDFDIIEREHIDSEEFDAFIDVARCVDGCMVAFSVRRPEKSEPFKVSMRSMCKVDVSAICTKFGGGGHIKAAGCNISAPSIDDAINIILKEVSAALNR